MISEMLQSAREYEEMRGEKISPEERPAFHLTPRVGWMNDPNGFSFYKGQYHLFYQYHPFSLKWGPMHWGHAVSRDLVHWEYLPCALAPDAPYDSFGCFSGSAITLPDGKQLLLYTGVKEEGGGCSSRTVQTQCVAIGDGMDYEKCAENPVLTGEDLPEEGSCEDFRDPKIWQEEAVRIFATRKSGRSRTAATRVSWEHGPRTAAGCCSSTAPPTRCIGSLIWCSTGATTSSGKCGSVRIILSLTEKR